MICFCVIECNYLQEEFFLECIQTLIWKTLERLEVWAGVTGVTQLCFQQQQ